MTLQKLADLAHVSVSTVSKAFSGSADISEQTRRLVFETARRHGCYEQFDKGVYHKKIIAVICPELESLYYGKLLTELERRIREMGGTMALSVSRFDPEVQQELFLYHSCYQKTNGVVLIGRPEGIKNPNLFPAVSLSASADSTQEWLAVGTDYFTPILQAVDYLLSLGHRNIVFLGEPKTYEKEHLYRRAMEKRGMKAKSVVTDARFEACGFLGMSRLLNDLPTAVIAAYDTIAIGAAHCLRSHGFSVPGTVSLIGMDDLPVTSYLDIPLTTISDDSYRVCEAALALLLKKMEQKYFVPKEKISIPGQFIIRNSVCPPNL